MLFLMICGISPLPLISKIEHCFNEGITQTKFGDKCWSINRRYVIDNEIIRSGWNLIAVQVTDRHNPGGMVTGPVEFRLENISEK